MRQKLPNSISIFVWGLLSLFLCCGLGFFASIIALVQSSTPTKLYRANPEQWEGYSLVSAGKVLAVIGLVLNFLSAIYYIVFIGAVNFSGFVKTFEQGMNINYI